MCQYSWGHVQTPDTAIPIERGSPALGGGIRVNHSLPGDLSQGHSCPKKWKVWPRGEGLAAGQSKSDPELAAIATPTWGLGHGASVEAVLYGAAPPAWLPPQPPYAPGASETVSVVPPSCSWTYSSSSTPTEHIPAWGVLSDWPNPTPYREKRSSVSGRVCSFPSWPEGPTGWGARAPNPCVRITDPETKPVWASHRGSWECACPVLSRAASATFMKTQGNRDSPKGRTLYWYACLLNANRRNGLWHGDTCFLSRFLKQ